LKEAAGEKGGRGARSAAVTLAETAAFSECDAKAQLGVFSI